MAVEAKVGWKIEKKNECRIQQRWSGTAKVIEQLVVGGDERRGREGRRDEVVEGGGL
jgi:hypothetical protein